MSDLAWILLLVPIILGLAFAVIRRVPPVHLAYKGEEPLTEDDRRTHRRWDAWSVPLFLLLLLPLASLWHQIIEWTVGQFQHTNSSTKYLIQPIPWLVLTPTLLLGSLSSAVLVSGLVRFLLGDRFRIHMIAEQEQLGMGFDVRRFSLGFAVLMIVGSAVSCTAAVRSFARFDETGVEIGRPLSSRSMFYKYSRVRAIEHRATSTMPGGRTLPCPHYVILFDDGASFSTRLMWNTPSELAPERRIARLVAQRSGQPIVERP